jgi:hypothetical protein
MDFVLSGALSFGHCWALPGPGELVGGTKVQLVVNSWPSKDRDAPLPKHESISARELVGMTQPESSSPDYLEWKREKILRAIRRADEHPDIFINEKTIWITHGLGT